LGTEEGACGFSGGFCEEFGEEGGEASREWGWVWWAQGVMSELGPVGATIIRIIHCGEGAGLWYCPLVVALIHSTDGLLLTTTAAAAAAAAAAGSIRAA